MSSKELLRKRMNILKRSKSPELLSELSEKIMYELEKHPLFQEAKCILLYNALPDEPATMKILNKYKDKKQLLLPVVSGNDIVLKKYINEDALTTGAFNILEPTGQEYVELENLDLLIIPGVAFDKQGGRLGRGRGFYDRFLGSNCINAYKIGVCFPFQIIESVPMEKNDYYVDEVVSIK